MLIVVPNLATWEQYEPVYYIKLLRIFHIKRFFVFFDQLEKFVAVIFDRKKSHKVFFTNLVRLLKNFCGYYMIFHVFACIFLFQSPEQVEEGEVSMVNTYLKGQSTMSIYNGMLYFVVTTFSTCGFGDIVTKSQIEMVTNIISILGGQLMFSYVSGKLRSGFSNNIEILVNPQQQLDLVQEEIELLFMKFFKIKGANPPPKKFVKRSLSALDQNFRNSIGTISQDTFYQELPPKIRKRLLIYLFRPVINHFSHFFENEEFEFSANFDFILGMVQSMTTQVFYNEQVVLPIYQKTKYMYFI
jgi:hypothetical protein